MDRVTPPCRDCKDRTGNCHSLCEKYQKYVEANEEKKRIIRKGASRAYSSGAVKRRDKNIMERKRWR